MPQTEEQKEEKLNPQQELFCRYYTQNSEFFSNATLAYAEAYDFDLDSLDRTREKDEKGKDIPGTSVYDRAYNTCSVNGSKSLRNPKIQLFIRKCLNEMMTDEVVDGELVKTILQNYELPSKMAAIREYNKLKQRITEKTDITSGGKPIPILGGYVQENIGNKETPGTQ